MSVIEATLCYLKDDGRVLMLHRNKKTNDLHIGKYNGLGGKLEARESPLECAKREVLEESGLSANSFQFAGHITFPNFDGSNDWSVFLFTASGISGSLLTDPPEGDLVWVKQDELLELNLWEGDYIFLPWVMAGKRFLAKFEYHDGRYIEHSVCFISAEDSS
jgi:8-oxo-dGTP diphosphatase